MNNNIELEKVEFSKQSYYLYYDDNGKITDLLNYKKEFGSYVELSEKFVVDFRSSGKSLESYTIKIGKNIRLERKTIERGIGTFYIVSERKDADVIISVSKKALKFKLSKTLNHKIMNQDNVYKFYIVSTDNLNFLKEVIKIKHSQLIKGYKISYIFNKNNDVLITSKLFDSYGINYE